MAPPDKSNLRYLKWIIGLIMVSFFFKASYDFFEINHPFYNHFFDLLMLLCLVVTLLIIDVMSRRMHRNEAEQYSRERLSMQHEVAQTVLRYKSLLEFAGDAIFVVGVRDNRLQEVNRQGIELLGYAEDELKSMAGWLLVAEEAHREYTSLVLRVRRRGMVQKVNLPFVRKDGTRFIGEVTARLHDLGVEEVVQVIIRDITQKLQVEQEIRQRNRKLSILNNIIVKANQSLDLTMVLGVTLRETFEIFGAEGGVVHLWGAEKDTLVLAASHDLSAGLRKELGSCVFHSAAGCCTVNSRHCHTVPDLGELSCSMGRLASADGWKSAAAAPLKAKNRFTGVMHIMTRQPRGFTEEEMQFFTTICHQIGIVIEHARLFEEMNWKSDELVRSHQFLEKSSHKLTLSQEKLKNNLTLVERANLELERLDRMKNHFLGMISHEFKTPLTGILGGAEFLLANQGERFTAEERQLLEMIYRGGARLNEIVSDLIKVAKLETNMMELNRKPVRLHEILDLLLKEITPRLEQRGQKILLQELNTLPYFSGDREYLMEVFMELLENAMKFTPDAGEITISASVVNRARLADKQSLLERFHGTFYQQMGNNCYLHVEIRDSGIGIAAEEQEKVFEKFYAVGDIRHHSSSKLKFQGKGAGLGLAIVKGMIEAHGGMIWVESHSQDPHSCKGSAFSLLLPLEEGGSQPSFSFI